MGMLLRRHGQVRETARQDRMPLSTPPPDEPTPTRAPKHSRVPKTPKTPAVAPVIPDVEYPETKEPEQEKGFGYEPQG